MVTRPLTNKQGLARTLEVTIAVVLTFLILVFLIPQANVQTNNANEPDVNLDILLSNKAFRSCLIETNTSCIERKLSFVMPPQYTYSYILTTDNFTPPVRSSTEEIYTKSDLLFALNATEPTEMTPYRFILYYW